MDGGLSVFFCSVVFDTVVEVRKLMVYESFYVCVLPGGLGSSAVELLRRLHILDVPPSSVL